MALTDKLYDFGKKAVITAAALSMFPNYSDAQLIRKRQRDYQPQTIERKVENPSKEPRIIDYSYQEIRNVIGDYLIKEREEELKESIISSTPLDRNRIFQVFSKPQTVYEKLSKEEQKKYNEFNPNNLSDKKKEFYIKNLLLKLDLKKQGTPYAGKKYDPIKLTLFLMEEAQK